METGHRRSVGLPRLWDGRAVYYWLAGLAVATRILGWWFGSGSPPEEGKFITIALKFKGGEGLIWPTPFGDVSSGFPPLMALVHAFFMSFFTDFRTAERGLFLGLSALTGIMFFELGRRLMPRNAAVIASALFLMYPPLWFRSMELARPALAIPLLTAAAALTVIAWDKKTPVFAWIAGTAWGLLTLTAGEFFIALPVALVIAFWAIGTRRDQWIVSGLIAAGFLLIWSPWMIRNWAHHDRIALFSTNAGIESLALYGGATPVRREPIALSPEIQSRLSNEPSERKRSMIARNEALRAILKNPLRTISRLGGNAWRFWKPWLETPRGSMAVKMAYAVCFSLLGIAALIGLFLIPLRDPKWVFIGMIVVLVFLMSLPFIVRDWQRDALTPLLFLLAMRPWCVRSPAETRFSAVGR